MTARVSIRPVAHSTTLTAVATAEGITLRGSLTNGIPVEVLITLPELDGLRQMAGQVMELRRRRVEPELTPILLVDIRE